jgi:hypothetical protein
MDSPLQDIGNYIFRYADAKCHLWNAYFKDIMGDLSVCEPLESFEAIDRRLFFALVCQPLGIEYDWSCGTVYLEGNVVKTRSIDQIVIMPRSTLGPHISIQIGEKQGNNTAWNELKSLASAGLSFAFIELFQWDSYGFLNLPMVRGKITACAEHPECVGREALIDIDKVAFFVADAES